ncbi:MAG: peptide ABC transporter substrate-binding protein [Armatimonadota bacterium]
MFRQIPEADWKVFRRLQPLAMDRFCRRVLEEVEGIAGDAGRSPHQRYLELYRLLQERDKELERGFDTPRRSTALLQLAHIYAAGLLTEEELAQFGDETRGFVECLVNG